MDIPYLYIFLYSRIHIKKLEGAHREETQKFTESFKKQIPKP